MKMKIEKTWEELEKQGGDFTSGYLTRRILPDVNYDVYLVIEKPSNTRLLMLRVNSTFLDLKTVYPASNSFTVNRVALSQDGEEYGTLQLVLTNAKYKDIFTTLVQDIVDYLASVTDGRAAIFAFITRLKRWQTFLEKHSPEGLSEAAQQGLYGELWFLRKSVFPHWELIKGLRGWTGPRGTQQDFQFPGCAVEVKTTSAKQHQKLAIASERQLDDTGAGIIVLLHLSLDVRQGQGETLPEIVANVRSLVADNAIASNELENLLFEVGYLDIHTTRYDNVGYSIREHNYFKVWPDFPKIIESDLRNGVGDVRYTISVAECKRFSIPESEVILLMETQL
ncbi:MAG: hypothetical protein DCF21_02875 [Leptolyngbya sp.]|nr:MAG: hypothetical protein DCF21_02875 [Leptolyngbya sp.]